MITSLEHRTDVYWPGTTSSGADATIFMIIIGMAVGIVVLVIALVRRRR